MDNLELWYRANRGKFADGIPPVSFKSNGDALTNWTIYGYTSPNLFDVSAVSADSGIDRDTGETVESSGSMVSDWIAYDSSQDLFISASRTIAAATSVIFAFYDSEKNYIDWVGVAFSPGQHSYEVTMIPDSAAFFRVQFFDDGFSDVMINQGTDALPYEPFGAVGERTENLFEILPQYLDAANWERALYPGSNKSYFTFVEIPDVFAQTIKDSGIISAKVFLKPDGTYYSGLVFAITPLLTGTVDNQYRILQNDGTVLDLTVDISEWAKIYLCIGYGPSITNANEQQLIDSFFDNFNLAIISGATAPTEYVPYGYKIPVTCGGETTNIYIGDTPLGTGQTVTGSETKVAIPTVDGNNTLSIGTTVQPSKVVISAASGITESLKKYFDYKYGVLKMAGIKE